MEIVRKLFGLLGSCASDGHKVDRRRVRHRKGDHYASCRRCGARLVRYGPDDWRPAESLESKL